MDKLDKLLGEIVYWLKWFFLKHKKTYEPNCKGGFTLNEKEQEDFKKWLKKHDRTCKYSDSMKTGAIGGRLTYMFTPTSLGVITKVKCACGEKIDLTDTDLW